MSLLKKKLLTDRSGQLQDQIQEELSKAMADEIDAQVMRGFLVDTGWHEVVLNWAMTIEVSKEVDQWVAEKSKGPYWNRGLVWLFERRQDAVWFSLRWSKQYV